jgi:hypothetical protein
MKTNEALSDSFSFVRFLKDEWKQDMFAARFQGRELYFVEESI